MGARELVLWPKTLILSIPSTPCEDWTQGFCWTSSHGPGATLPMVAQPPGSRESTHGSSWHQKWLTAKAIATRTRNTAMAIRPCIQGCKFPRPGGGRWGVLQ